MEQTYRKSIHILSNGETVLENLTVSDSDITIYRRNAFTKPPISGQSVSASFLSGDVIIIPLDGYLEHFYQKDPPEDKAHNPVFIILVETHQLDDFSRLSLEGNTYPLFHPFSISQLNALVRSLSCRNRTDASQISDRYRVLFQKGPFIQLLIFSGSGRIVDCNHAASEFYNRSCEQLKGTSFFDLHADVSQSLQEMILPDNAKGLNKFVIKLTGPDQQVKDLEFNSEHVVLEDESLIYLSIQDVTLSLQSGELLHQQHEMLRSTLSSIDDLFFTMNRHGEFIEYYQPGSNQQLSLSSDLFVGKSIKEVGFPEMVAQKYLDAIGRVLETGRTEQIEYHLDAFGTRLWYNAKVTPRRNSVNVADGVTVLCRDVSRQKKVEETLIRARDFYLTLLNDFPSMIWKTNASKKADYFNKTWLEFTGRDLKQENTTDWANKIHSDDTPRFLSVLSEAYQQKKPFQLEHRLRHHDGSYRWILDVGRPFYNLDGQFAGFIGSGYDITERRNTEDMLRIQRSALENALEGMLIIDASTDGNQVIYGNKELSKITGISLNQINGMDFLEVIGAPEDSAISQQIKEAISRQISFKGEYLCVNPYGAESWRLLLIAPVHDRRGMVAHFVVVLADITESKIGEKILMEKNKELEKTNSELDSFVYSTSHELRSPLMSVLGLINLLEMETKNPEQEKYIGMIKESINKLDQIIHDIIDYSRNSRFEVRHEKVNFRPMIDKAINNLKYMTGAEKILFQVEVDDDHVLFSDVRRVEIIFNNFISNCIKFHNFDQPEPAINIRVKTLPHKTVVTIRDNGSGIPSTHLPRIYDMFFRGNQRSNGGGIGLYIVKEIVEKLQGTIEVTSEEGEYTQFVVEIPNKNKVILS